MRIVPIPMHHVRVINRCIFSFALVLFRHLSTQTAEPDSRWAFLFSPFDAPTVLIMLTCDLRRKTWRLKCSSKVRLSPLCYGLPLPHISASRLGLPTLQPAPFLAPLAKPIMVKRGVRSSVRSLFSFRLHHATYCSSQLKLCRSIKVRKSSHRVSYLCYMDEDAFRTGGRRV